MKKIVSLFALLLTFTPLFGQSIPGLSVNFVNEAGFEGEVCLECGARKQVFKVNKHDRSVELAFSGGKISFTQIGFDMITDFSVAFPEGAEVTIMPAGDIPQFSYLVQNKGMRLIVPHAADYEADYYPYKIVIEEGAQAGLVRRSTIKLVKNPNHRSPYVCQHDQHQSSVEVKDAPVN